MNWRNKAKAERPPRHDVVLNGSYPAAGVVKALVRAVGDPAILVEKGGYIFKVAEVGEVLHIGLLPTIIGDIRNVHHAIDLKVEASLIINGFFNTDGTLAMVLLKPGASPCIGPGERGSARRLVKRFCSVLLRWGLGEGFPLDVTTPLTLREVGLLEADVDTLGELLARLGDTGA